MKLNLPIIYLILRTICFSGYYFIHGTISNDMIENVAWGQEWQLGYYKHPPLFAWIAEITMIIGNSSIAFYQFCSHLIIGSSIIATYYLARRFLTEKEAIISAILVDLISFYHLENPGLNANTLLYTLFPITIIYFLNTVENNKIKDSILFGFFAGLCMLTKYYSVLLFFSFFIYILLYERRFFANYLLYLSGIVFIFTIFPHAIWVYENNFETFKYIANSVNDKAGFITLIKIIIKDLANLSLLIIAIILLKIKSTNDKIDINNKINLINIITIIPFILQIFYALFFGKPNVHWISPTVFIIPLFLFIHLKIKIQEKNFYTITLIIFFTANLCGFLNALYIKSAKNRWRIKTKEIALMALKKWDIKYQIPPQFTNNQAVAIYGREKFKSKIHLLINKNHSPWINERSLKKNQILLTEYNY